MPVETNLPEPKTRTTADRSSYCDRAAKGLLYAMLDVDAGIREVGTDFMAATRARFSTVANWTRDLGPAGEEASRQIRNVDDNAGRIVGELRARMDDISRYPRAVREEAALAHRALAGGEALSGDARKVYDLLDTSFESIIRMAQVLGVRRQMPDGELLPLEGSGRAYPTILNKKGLKVARDAYNNKRSGDALEAALRVTALNHPGIRKGLEAFDAEELLAVHKVAMGHTPEGASPAVVAAGESIRESVDFGFARLATMHDQSLRGVVPYLERTRVDVPGDMLSLDPVSALPAFYRRIGLQLAAFREWGPDLLGLDAALGRIMKENGAAQAVLLRNYIGIRLGNPGIGGLPQEARLVQHVRDLTMLRLFGGTFIGPLRNAGQPFTNNIDQPIGAHVRALKELPPFVHKWVEHAQPLRKMIIRSGALTFENPITEFGTTFIGPKARKAAVIHVAAVAENEYRSAAIGYYGLLMNVRRLMEMQGEQGPIAKTLQGIRHLSLDPEAAVGRAIERSGMDPKKIERIRQRAQDATPEELQALLDTPTEVLTEEDWLTAMRRASRDTQFGMEFADRHVYSGQDNAYSVIYMLKNWGVRQVGFIYERVVKEAALGNAKPLVKFLAATFFLGELYNNVRDAVTGNERSLINKIRSGESDAQTVAFTTLTNIGDGGGVGILMDVMFGWSNLAFGPAGSTGMNLLRAGQHVVQNPEQAATAAKDFLDREFVVTGQARGITNRIKEASREEHSRFFDYGQWRGRSFNYLTERDRPTPGDKVKAGAIRFMRGRGGHFPSERSLTYEQAAKAITGNDIDGAASYIERLLRTAEGDAKEVTSILAGLNTARSQRSPLGPVPQNERAKFLAQFSETERREGRTLQRDWMRDWNAAVRKARKSARRN